MNAERFPEVVTRLQEMKNEAELGLGAPGNAKPQLGSRALNLDHGEGFSRSNVIRSRQFSLAYPKGATALHLFRRSHKAAIPQLPKKVRRLLTYLLPDYGERINNPGFNSLEFEGIKNEAGRQMQTLAAPAALRRRAALKEDKK